MRIMWINIQANDQPFASNHCFQSITLILSKILDFHKKHDMYVIMKSRIKILKHEDLCNFWHEPKDPNALDYSSFVEVELWWKFAAPETQAP